MFKVYKLNFQYVDDHIDCSNTEFRTVTNYHKKLTKARLMLHCNDFKDKYKNLLKCRGGHQLQNLIFNDHEYGSRACDLCDAKIRHDKSWNSCYECDFDLCFKCSSIATTQE